MNAFLFRQVKGDGCLLGTLVIRGQRFSTIERPWLNNKSNESCIPTGKYLCKFMARSGSGKYKNVYHLQAVPGRTGILIHNGNLASHSRGCIILGMKRGKLGGKQAVLSSRSAMAKLNKITGKKDFYLTVLGGTR